MKQVEVATKYEILQIMPADGHTAVIYSYHGTPLTEMPLSALAVAAVTHNVYEYDEVGNDKLLSSSKDANTIVGIRFRDGVPQVVNEMGEFCGIKAPGQAIYDCIEQAKNSIMGRAIKAAMQMRDAANEAAQKEIAEALNQQKNTKRSKTRYSIDHLQKEREAVRRCWDMLAINPNATNEELRNAIADIAPGTYLEMSTQNEDIRATLKRQREQWQSMFNQILQTNPFQSVCTSQPAWPHYVSDPTANINPTKTEQECQATAEVNVKSDQSPLEIAGDGNGIQEVAPRNKTWLCDPLGSGTSSTATGQADEQVTPAGELYRCTRCGNEALRNPVNPPGACPTKTCRGKLVPVKNEPDDGQVLHRCTVCSNEQRLPKLGKTSHQNYWPCGVMMCEGKMRPIPTTPQPAADINEPRP